MLSIFHPGGWLGACVVVLRPREKTSSASLPLTGLTFFISFTYQGFSFISNTLYNKSWYPYTAEYKATSLEEMSHKSVATDNISSHSKENTIKNIPGREGGLMFLARAVRMRDLREDVSKSRSTSSWLTELEAMLLLHSYNISLHCYIIPSQRIPIHK
ncbi:hypothetical protein E2C01_043318 [Portunus trituberculatus]|uniref:Uncharacterized protein n=1 Tax=Portunus trituberculatus TaxID=210409 RepID=A0A5B7FW00_PORTR|nr:hypothetical protein [Portunus trituberculatus]